MRLITTALLATGVLTAPVASADTVQEITTNGAIFSIAGFDLDFNFTADGKFSTPDGLMTGTWRINENELCTTGEDGVETCLACPADQKSGDEFEVKTPQGLPVTVKIK